MAHSFSGQTAVITGGASGIGAALARAAASRGMNMLIADVDEAGLRATAESCPSVEVHMMRVDVSDAADVERMADQAYARFGVVDLLCNNAGIVPGGRHRAVWEYEVQDWHWAFDVNVLGIVNGLRSFVPLMLEADRPAHILNTTSVSGFISGAGSPVYGASKHAAVRVTEALYASLLERDAPIGVSMLCPGLVNTRIFETERVRPAHLRSAAADIEEPEALRSIAAGGADPETVARQAFEGVEAKRFYIFTSDNFDESIEARTQAILSRSNPQFDGFTAMSRRDAENPVSRY
ncbi:SDR family NAD(P)-dependent oxidoreductase (plasmid) [Sphingobium sp. SJ10-10]|uniref:SDR family NAD(P)-dependent oxidoreductase n=1 Tax=Sphingobium sp. SJ10-10 TaxID=3114999 RepID=UPI002E19EE0D|nr:SDR family NAD(P)-dependent oxidoreductase [Sphingobium sp. SJ10-10]